MHRRRPDPRPGARTAPDPAPNPAEGAARPDDRLAFLEEELGIAYDARAEAKPGSQAFAALSRQIRGLRDDIDAIRNADRPTKGLSATEILDRAREYAQGLPEPILAVFANEWALRHRVRWTPVDKPQSTQDEESD